MVHRGRSDYLPYVLAQAKSRCGDRVFLLGDEAARVPGTPLVRFEQLNGSGARRFEQNYVHLSRHRVEFELLCWLRWYYNLELMREEDLESVIHMDSDVLLYSRPEEIDFTRGGTTEGALLVEEQDHATMVWSATAHLSYWPRDLLGRFCEFAVESFADPRRLEKYQQKWRWHVENNAAGGVCDMTGLYLFWVENENLFNNLAVPRNGTVVDMSIGWAGNLTPDEYRTHDGLKVVEMRKGVPYLVRTEGDERVRAHALHFQGRTKAHIDRFYLGNEFPGKLLLDARHRMRRMPRPWKQLRTLAATVKSAVNEPSLGV